MQLMVIVLIICAFTLFICACMQFILDSTLRDALHAWQYDGD